MDKNHLSQLRTWFSENFFAPKLVAYCFCHSAANMARKNVQKTMFDSTSEMIDFSQSENRKNNRKTFEGASVEPTKFSHFDEDHQTR